MLRIYKFFWLFPYFLLGNVCRSMTLQKNWSRRPSNGRTTAFFTVLSFALYILVLYLFYSGEAYQEFYSGFHLDFRHTGFYLVYYLEGCLGIFLIFRMADVIRDSCRIAAKAGYYSIDIYVLHMFFVKIFQAVSGILLCSEILYNGIAVPVYSFGVVFLTAAAAEHVLHKSVFYRWGIGGR